MSQPSHRRRIPTNHQKSRPPTPISSPGSHRPFNRFKPSKPIKHLQRSKSEPILRTLGVGSEDENRKADEVFPRRQTYIDIFVSPHIYASPPNLENQKYKKDAKVVVNVTVQGSPGPVRSLVKLGASVEDTIKLIVDRYNKEGRSPCLRQNSVSSFELHHSHFSLESINKTDKIGDFGTRSFYLRKSCSRRITEDSGGSLVSLSSSPKIVPVKASVPLQTHFVFFPTFLARKMSKIGRRMRLLWKVLVCSP